MAPGANSQLIEMFGQLLGKLDGIGDVKTQLGVLTNQVGLLTDSHNELKTKVLGNGKPGLTDRLRDLEENCENLEQWRTDLEKKEEKAEEEKKERSKEMRGMRNTIIVSVIIFVITTLLNLGMTYWITARETAEKSVSAISSLFIR